MKLCPTFALAILLISSFVPSCRVAFAQSAPPPRPVDPFSLRARVAAPSALETPRSSEAVAPSASGSESDADASGALDRIALKNGTVLEARVTSLSVRSGLVFSRGSDVSRVPLVEVDYIEASVSEPFAQGCALYARGRDSGASSLYRSALTLFQSARRDSPRRLEREWATAKIVDCLLALGRAEEAAVEFFLLCRTESHGAFLSSIPLFWQNRRATIGVPGTDRSLEDLAAEQLANDKSAQRATPAGRLLAASILINSQHYGRDARATLQALATLEPGDDPSPDEVEMCRVISLLANAQLWRPRLLASPDASELERWRRATALLPNAYQPGPRALVGQAERRLGRAEEATRSLMFAATLARDASLARFCAESAAQIMSESGGEQDARRVLRRFRIEESGDATRPGA